MKEVQRHQQGEEWEKCPKLLGNESTGVSGTGRDAGDISRGLGEPGAWGCRGGEGKETHRRQLNPNPKRELQAGDDDDSEGEREVEGSGRMLGWTGIHSGARVVVAGVSVQIKYREHLPPQGLASKVRKMSQEQSLSWHC